MAFPRPGRRKSKPKRGKAEKPLTARKITRATLTEFKDHWKAYVLILAVVTIPSDLITLIFQLSTDQVASTYLSFAAIIMNASLIWAIVRHDKDGRMPSVISSYYDGSVALVRYIVVTIAIVVLLIPAALGGALYATGLEAVTAAGSPGTEVWLIAFVALLIASPSFVLLVRFGLASYGVIADGLGPIEALRRTRRYTLGRFWRVTGRFVILGLLLTVISIPITIVTIILGALHLGSISTTFFEIATTLVALPVANIYLYRLYRNLQDTYKDLNITTEVPAAIENELIPDEAIDIAEEPDDVDEREAAESPA
jgi:membrane-anchored glycerophosphoryl diester phosphodiesterase (GDPDase)